MAKSLAIQFKAITDRLKRAVATDAIQPGPMKALGEFTANLIVKRTRVGYGVDRNQGEKQRLKALSNRYIEHRKQSSLSSTTNAKKSNLTFTGQMLESVKVIRASNGKILIGPTGTRRDGQTNTEIALVNANRGRAFNNVSRLEFNQILRFYRKTFGDLARKKRLIR